ncbi:MAG: right-handed parallel beta-helix repeat-containing protein [Clostridia bacterium]|nr:right-handed parallel beta-helix repeat-containing protein [Clostridia bacterium]
MKKLFMAAFVFTLAASLSAGHASAIGYLGGDPYVPEYKTELVSDEREDVLSFREKTDSPYFTATPPTLFSEYTEPERTLTEGDIWVAPDGDDSGAGTFDDPFATLERARDEIRSIKKSAGLPDGGLTVAVRAGRYNVNGTFSLRSEDSGTEAAPIVYTAYGDGDVIFTGNMLLDPADFGEPSPEILAALTPEAAANVRVLDLKKYGVAPSSLTLKNFGANTGATNVEFYLDGRGYELARYPNGNRFALTDLNITAQAGGRGSVFRMKEEDAEHVKNWKFGDSAQVLGMFRTEYSDSTSKTTVDPAAGTFRVPDVKVGFSAASYRYFFYNVLDELDEPGEWYLDRENCLLYVFPESPLEGSAPEFTPEFSSDLVSASGCEWVTLRDFTLSGTQGRGIRLDAVSHFTVERCRLYAIGNTAISGGGDNILVSGCEINYVGRAGISLSGGDKATMTRAYIKADNNRVTHWGRYGRVFSAGIEVSGQGNTISHNEICDGTSVALGSSGNLNFIEYNLIHDTTNYASDCGSFYNGSSWTSGGIVIRYNCFYNIGSDQVNPSAIFWDDGMAYQTAYGNLFVGVAASSASIGGGFGTVMVNNVIVDTGAAPIFYDKRPQDGYKAGADFYRIGGFLWNLYKSTPYMTSVWKEHFPFLSQISGDESDTVDPHFPYNPAFSLFADNVFLNADGKNVSISATRPDYSTRIDNYIGTLDEADDIFVDPGNGDYRIRNDAPVWDVLSDFEPIPYHLIGRY